MKVRERLTDPTKWCKGKYAADTDGAAVRVLDAEAVRWCLEGAPIRCYDERHLRLQVSKQIYENLKTSTYYWNDAPERTFEEVKALVDRLDI